MMNCPLLPLLLLSACQDYHLQPGNPGLDDSGGPAPDEQIGPPAEVLPFTPLVEDTGTRACDLEPRPAEPYLGAPTCTPLNGVTWDVVVEEEILAPDEWLVSPLVVAPGPSGAAMIYTLLQLTTGDDSALGGFDPGTGSVDVWVEGTHVAVGGLTVFKGANPTDRGRKAAAFWGGAHDEVVLVDLETGAMNIGAAHEEGVSGIARDLWHDGAPEVVTGSFAYAMDGAVDLSYPTRTVDKWNMLPSISDVDGQGHDQLMNAKGWWDATTGLGVEWDSFSLQPYPENPEGYIYFMGGAVSWQGAVVAAGHTGESHFAADATGQVLWLDALDDGDNGRETYALPALGDLDGDGEPELTADLHGDTVMVYELDGSMRWSAELGGAHFQMTNSASLADLDADGVYEMLVWGDDGLWILGGLDGAVLSHWQEGYNPSALVAPIIADVDADGSAEIVLAGRREGDDGWWNSRIFILGPATGRWARTRPVWNQLPYDVTGVRDDGTIPVFPRSNPQTYNAWRAQPAHDGDHPDLEVEVVETCRDDERGVVALQAVIHNRGSQDAPAGAVVRLLTWDEATDGPLQEVAARTLDDPIPTMTTSAGVIFRVSTSEWATRQVVQVDGAHPDECDLVNDRVDVWEE